MSKNSGHTVLNYRRFTIFNANAKIWQKIVVIRFSKKVPIRRMGPYDRDYTPDYTSIFYQLMAVLASRTTLATQVQRA